MKVRITKSETLFYGLQVAGWLVFLIVPAISAFAANNSWDDVVNSLRFSFRIMWIPASIFFVNSFILIPFGYYRERRWLFWAGNAIIIGLLAWHYFGGNALEYINAIPNENAKRYALTSYYSTSVLNIFMYVLLAAIALLGHHMYRTISLKRQLKEEQQKRTEAELEWLKNQINPHFLFNTLNNISSLVQIDADAAQDSIAQLSDLLRYAMYQTDKPMVPLAGEIDFMQNYIALMRLRHNDMLKLTVEWPDTPPSTLHLPPLLFISLIENAFKHGVSSSRPSHIDISLKVEGTTLIFTCVNSNYPKDDQNRAGSGIGLENTRRRLDLMYPGRYTWEYGVTPDGTEYRSVITIK